MPEALRVVAQQRRAMGQVVKLQAAHAVEAEAMLGARSAEASRQRERLLVKARERLLVKARDAWKAARTAARARAASVRGARKHRASASASSSRRATRRKGIAEDSASPNPSLPFFLPSAPLAQLLW